jgi:beta-galactosidase
VTGKQFELVFNKKTGLMTKIIKNEINLITEGGGPILHLWRAAHKDDDNWAQRDWDEYGVNMLRYHLTNFNFEKIDQSTCKINVSMKAEGKKGFGVTHTATYLISGDGIVKVDNQVQFSGTRIQLARIGVRLLFDKKLDHMTWFGRGPWENYADRKTASDVGLYTLNVNDQYEYEKPMEHGNHEDVRWAKLSGKSISTITFMSDKNRMQVSALPHSDEQMQDIEYKIDLPPSTSTVFTLATKTLGVGSAGCGPRPLDKYKLGSDNTSFSYTIKL